MSGDVAQLVKHVSSIHKALGSIPSTHKLSLVVNAYILALRWRQEDQELKAILYSPATQSLKLAWDAQTLYKNNFRAREMAQCLKSTGSFFRDPQVQDLAPT